MSEGPELSPVRQASEDLPSKKLALWGALSILVGLGSVAVVAYLLEARHGSLRGAPEARVMAAPPSAVPLERGQIRDATRDARQRERARRELREWGWVRRPEVAKIPISEATRWLLDDARRGHLSWQEAGAAGGASQAPSALPVEGAREP